MKFKVIVDVSHQNIIDYIERQMKCKLKFIILFTIIGRIEEKSSNYFNNFDVAINEIEIISIAEGNGYGSKWKPVEKDVWSEIEKEIMVELNTDNHNSLYAVYSTIRNEALSLYYDTLIESNQIKPYKLPQ